MIQLFKMGKNTVHQFSFYNSTFRGFYVSNKTECNLEKKKEKKFDSIFIWNRSRCYYTMIMRYTRVAAV